MLDERTGCALQTKDESGSTSSPTLRHPERSEGSSQICSYQMLSSWRPVGAIGFIALLVAPLLLSACTDYVSKIDDQIAELKANEPIVLSSSSITQKSSSSVILPVSSSSSVIPSSSSVSSPMSSWSGGGAGAIGSITDSRDGQSYKTVTIGTQTWMAQNLNYETANSYCYNDNASNCTKYGRLYTWAAAMDSVGTWSANGKGCGYNKTCTPTYPVRGVCPTGWHLPTKAEFETLFTAVGGSGTAGKILKSTTGWNSGGNGTDAYSFSALLAGGRYSSGGRYDDEGDAARFWSSTEDSRYDALYMFLYDTYDDAELIGHYKYNGFSVRCVKDE